MTMSRNVPFISPDQAGDELLGRTIATTVQPVAHPLQYSLSDPYKSADGQYNIRSWRVLFEDTRGGLNYDIGPLETYFQRVKKSSLYTGHYRTVCLPLLTTNATTPDPTTPLFMSSCNFLGQAVVGIAAANNASLFTETSTTNPAMVAKTYSPGSIINGVTSAVINGTRSLLVLREGGAIQVLSDLASTPTVAGTMNTDTTQAYGVIQVPQFMSPEMRLLIYAGGKIRMLRGTDAIAREPDDMWSNVPNYGYALGMASLQISAYNRENRAFWVWPKSTTLSAHMLTKGSESPGHIVHTDEFGRNPSELDVKLPFVYYAALVNGGIACSDGQKVVFHNGMNADVILDNNYRGFDSDSQVRIRGFYVKEASLYVEEEIQASSSGSAATVRHILRYDFETASWHQVSGDTTLSGTGAFNIAATGSLPVGASTGYLQTYSDGSWRRKYEPPYGVNPFSLRQVSPGGSGNAQSYESAGTITWPSLQLPTIEVWPKVIRRMQFLGDVDTGGAGAKVSFTLPGLSPAVDFTALLNQASRVRTFAQNNARFQDLTISATITGSGTATKTPNVVPFVIEGLAYQPTDMDEIRDVRPRRWNP